MGYPRGLISYTTEHNLSGQKTRLVRPRLIGYAVALIVMIGLFSWAVADRSLVKLDVIKDRVMFRYNDQGELENSYTLKVMNKSQQPITFVIDVEGLEGLTYHGKREVFTEAGEVLPVQIDLSIKSGALPSSTNNILFRVQAKDDPQISTETDSRFTGPAR